MTIRKECQRIKAKILDENDKMQKK
jgi:hypothetical protein